MAALKLVMVLRAVNESAALHEVNIYMLQTRPNACSRLFNSSMLQKLAVSH